MRAGGRSSLIHRKGKENKSKNAQLMNSVDSKNNKVIESLE